MVLVLPALVGREGSCSYWGADRGALKWGLVKAVEDLYMSITDSLVEARLSRAYV